MSHIYGHLSQKGNKNVLYLIAKIKLQSSDINKKSVQVKDWSLLLSLILSSVESHLLV